MLAVWKKELRTRSTCEIHLMELIENGSSLVSDKDYNGYFKISFLAWWIKDGLLMVK